MRINQFFSRQGICSKRQADRWIVAGKVCVDGVPAHVGMQVYGNEKILIDNKPLGDAPAAPWFVLYHKPRGIVTSKAAVRDNLTEALQAAGLALPQHWFAVGRLDKASEGLLLLTNQGAFAEALLQSKTSRQPPKRYLVVVDQPVKVEQLAELSAGVVLPSRAKPQITLPCQVSRVAQNILYFELRQGLHRQIRRMCALFGWRVERLLRLEFAGLTLNDLGVGRWRYLSAAEIAGLQQFLIEESSHESKTPCNFTEDFCPSDGDELGLEEVDFGFAALRSRSGYHHGQSRQDSTARRGVGDESAAPRS